MAGNCDLQAHSGSSVLPTIDGYGRSLRCILTPGDPPNPFPEPLDKRATSGHSNIWSQVSEQHPRRTNEHL